MGQHNETIAENKNKSKKDESEKVDINLYFGIFFDGTGANKFQMMLGKKFRRDKLFETYKTQLQAADADINNGHDILKHDRKYWEDKNIFTISELDQLYFDRDTEGRIEKRIIENCFANDDNNTSIGIASMPNDTYTTELLKKVATEVAGETQEDSSDYASSLKETMAEGETYTNIAILESCYQNFQKGNEKYVSFYVEGSGSDMQFAPKKSAHTISYALEGLAKGTGYTGVTAKVTKMVKMIERELYKVKDEPCNIVFDIFGFSRGATESRLFTYIFDSKELMKRFCGIEKNPFCNDSVKSKKVRFLGIYDTVSSIGAIRNLNPITNFAIGSALPVLGDMVESALSNPYNPETHSYLHDELTIPIDNDAKDTYTGSFSKYHDQNVYDYGLYATEKAESVFHICAMDEFRRNFALVDIESSICSKGLELFIPGCHTDIGGAASIGRDDKKQIDKNTKENIANQGGPRIHSNIETWWPSTNPFSQDAVYYKASFEGLQNIGLIGIYEKKCDFSGSLKKEKFKKEILSYTDTSLTIEKAFEFELYRYVKPGYSNIALNLMFSRIHKKIQDHNAFSSLLSQCYDVPGELKEYYSIINKKIEKEEKGRFFVSPDERTYQWLRQNYLHLSSNCDSSLVNGPAYFEYICDSDEISITGVSLSPQLSSPSTKEISYLDDYINRILMKKAIVARIIYSGKKTSRPKDVDIDHWTFMCEYNPTVSQIIPITNIGNFSQIKPFNGIDIIDKEIKQMEKELDDLTNELMKHIEDKGRVRVINSKVTLLIKSLKEKRELRKVLETL